MSEYNYNCRKVGIKRLKERKKGEKAKFQFGPPVVLGVKNDRSEIGMAGVFGVG
jgi:hypothetical protein